MAVYGVSPPDYFRVDDFLDFSDDQLFSESATSTATPTAAGDDHQFPAAASDGADCERNALNPHHSAFFTADLCVPSDDIAQLEWLSNFVEDSFTESPENSFAGTLTLRPETSFHSRSRSKRFRSTSSNNRRISSPESDSPAAGKSNPNAISTITKRREGSSSSSGITGDHSTSCETLVRRCSHCASEKTPQWRAGPLGPKTLCNACGVRYKSGRLVPEYRPAASPTFVLTQHSNSHRKVMELRRQKDILLQEQQQEEELQIFHRRHNFEVY